MGEGRPTISTHVLDTMLGLPARGIRVRLSRLVDDGAEVHAGEGKTDADGRVHELLAGDLLPGDYRLTFWLGGRGGFFERVSLDLHIDEVTRTYHVPLLLAPFGLTLYRGS